MISRTGIHAIRAMAALAQLPAGEFAGAARIAELIEAPQSYLGKLLQTLARAGLVQSQRGIGGGFALTRQPQDICVYEVVAAIEPIERWSGCVMGRGDCSETDLCAMHDYWKRVRQGYLDMLRGTSLADLVASGEVEIDPASLSAAQNRTKKPVCRICEATP